MTGEPWEYQNWGDGEPNNSSNVVADESCVAVWPVKWNDLANSNTYEQSATFVNGKHQMQPRKHRSKVTQDTSMSSMHCPNRSGSPAQSHGSKQRDAASGRADIWRSLNRQRKISFSTVQ